MFTKSRSLVVVRIMLVVLLFAGGFGVHPAQAGSIGFGWAKGIGGIDDDAGFGIATDGNGNTYVIGHFQDTVDFDSGAGTSNLTSAGSRDIFVTKYNSSGSFVWAKNFGGSLDDRGTGIVVDENKNIYITGYFHDTVDFDPGPGTSNLTSVGGWDIFIAKLNTNGELIWAESMGADLDDYGVRLTLDVSDNIYLVGSFQNTVDFDPGTSVSSLTSAGGRDTFISKFNSSGGFIWAKAMGGTLKDYGGDIVLDVLGNIYVAGAFNGTADFDPGEGISNLTSAGDNDVFIGKYDNNGNYIWAKGMGGISYDAPTQLALDGDGNVYATGEYEGEADFDPGAGTNNLSFAGGSDIFVTKLDTDGNFLWANGIGADYYDIGASIVVTADGNAYITGYFFNTVDFDPGPGVSNLTSMGSNDIFISRYNKDGNLVWVKRMGGTSSDSGYDISMDGTGALIITGAFQGTADFDPGAGTSNLTSNGSQDIFITRLTSIPQVYYVKWNAEGANNGSSWTDAYTDLQSALAAAQNGDEIWVASGTYKPGTARTNTFQLVEGLAVYGGFAGVETARDQRDPALHLTILSGDIDGNDINNDGNYINETHTDIQGSNSYIVVMGANNATLDGFTITAGSNNAMYNSNSSPTLMNVTFSGNYGSYGGGGMYNFGGSPALTNVTFSGNSANGESGGGMLNYQSSPTLINVTFSGNDAAKGGGISNWENSNPTLTNVTFSSNSANSGGGLYNHNSNPTLTNVIIADSTSGGDCLNDAGSTLNIASKNNLVEDATNNCGLSNGLNGNIIGVDSNLGPLANNGSFTQTMALLPGSPAINAGDDGACPTTDQRGVTRPQGSHCDIGAYEYVPTIPTPTLPPGVISHARDFSTPFVPPSGSATGLLPIRTKPPQQAQSAVVPTSTPMPEPVLPTSTPQPVFAEVVSPTSTPEPVVVMSVVDTTAPETTLLVTPGSTSRQRTALFAYESTEAGTFVCSLDGSAYFACERSIRFTGLGDGMHLFQVRAVDEMGNYDATPTIYTWLIETNVNIQRYKMTRK